MPEIYTLGSPGVRKQFSYSGTVKDGATLNYSGKPKVSDRFFETITQVFAGKRGNETGTSMFLCVSFDHNIVSVNSARPSAATTTI